MSKELSCLNLFQNGWNWNAKMGSTQPRSSKPGYFAPNITIDAASEWTRETLDRRTHRAPNYEGENHALIALAQQMAENPDGVLQKLTELLIGLGNAGSAGVSVLEEDQNGEGVFRWVALAGTFIGYGGGTMPRQGSPCGMVIDADRPLLFERPERLFPAAADLEPRITEVILAPFHIGGRPMGTIWAIAHDPAPMFTSEDMRLLISLAAFVSLKIFTPEMRSFAPIRAAVTAVGDMPSLTGRQRDILNRILDGQSNKNIAADLGISQRTAEAHRALIMKKMGVSNLSGLVRKALKSGVNSANIERETREPPRTF